MANTILIKKSGTASAVPSTLSYGELALNYADGRLYYKNSAGSIVPLTANSGLNAKLDALTFNGSTTTFNLASSSTAVTPANANSLLISLNGVIQEPGVAYTVSGSQITFSVAPASTDTFFGVHLTGATSGGMSLSSISGQSIDPGQVDVDNIRLNNNTISSTDTDGNLIVAPNGAGKILLGRAAADGSTNVVQLDGLTINGTDNVGNGISPTFLSKGSTFFVNQAGDLGIGGWQVPANTFGTHAAAFSFNGVNEAATQYTPIMLTTGYFAQLWLGTGGNVGIHNPAPGSRLVIKGGGTTSAGSVLNATNSSNASLLFVRNDGNVGIGNATPNSRLVVKGAGNTSATSSLDVTNAANSSILFVQNDGKVGVGTNAPSQKLDVNGTIAAPQVVIGTGNTLEATATHGSVIGGRAAKASMYGEITHAAGGFGDVAGTAQHRVLVARGITLAGAFTVTIASPAVFTKTGHSLSVGDTVKLSTTGALPTGLNTTATYYVISAGLTGDQFRLSTTRGGEAVTTSGTQSGTHTLVPTTALTLNGALGAQTPALMTIPERSTWAYNIKISAYASQNNQGAAWWFVGGLRRNLTTTIELETTQGFSYLENSFGNGLIAIDADTINNALDIRVTGLANQAVRWAAVIDIIQVSYGTP